jgi:hypothetical protein
MHTIGTPKAFLKLHFTLQNPIMHHHPTLIKTIIHLLPHFCYSVHHSSGDPILGVPVILPATGLISLHLVLRKTHKKKWRGVRSGDRGGHVIGPAHSILRPLTYWCNLSTPGCRKAYEHVCGSNLSSFPIIWTRYCMYCIICW